MSNQLGTAVLLVCFVLSAVTEAQVDDTSESFKENPSTLLALSTTTGLLPECTLDEETHYYAFVGNCTKYWVCFSGNRYLYECPGTFWWHQEAGRCDEPGDYCDDSITAVYPSTVITTTDIVPTTSGVDPRCSQGDVSYWPQPNDCHKYVECVDGVSYIISCPQNLYFSNQFKLCVRVDESECCREMECRPDK